MIELPVKCPENIHRTLEDKDFRHFAKQLAYNWADYYASSRIYPTTTTLLCNWAQVETLLAAARLWNIISASLAYDIATWLKAAEFVDNVPTLLMDEYDSKYFVNDNYINSLPDGSPQKYHYEQYFVYKELCAAFGVDPDVNDEN